MTEPTFPHLDDPYATALRDAVAYAVERFDPLGIIAGGSILRGEGNPASDLDLYVIHAAPWRQRVQRTFHGVPAELFVNPPNRVRRYFTDERREGRPITAHILATGAVLLERDPVIATLRTEAQQALAAAPDPGLEQLTLLRYMAATLFEDARDVAASDPQTANMILSQAVYRMLHYRFWGENHYLPRDKDLLAALGELAPDLAELARRFFNAVELDRRLAIATRIADLTVGAQGFFEWESERQDV